MRSERALKKPSAELIATITEQASRKLSAAEFEAYVNAPLSSAEKENALALIRWFKRRYPDPAARLAYARRAYSRWKAR